MSHIYCLLIVSIIADSALAYPIWKSINQKESLPWMKQMPEANDRPSSPSRAKSFTRAPITRPAGPPLVQPMEQAILAMMTARPMAAEATGKQMPAMKSSTKVEGANSMKFMWARWALLNLYHCSQLSLAEYRPLPVSGYPPFSISLPVACLCSVAKCCSMNSFVKYSPLTLPGKAKPITRISTARTAATMRTQPNSEGREKTKLEVAVPPRWRTSECMR